MVCGRHPRHLVASPGEHAIRTDGSLTTTAVRWLAALVALASGLAISTLSPRALATVGTFVLTTVLVWLLHRRGYEYFSAPSVATSFFGLYAALGVFLGPSLSSTKRGVSAALQLTEADALHALPYFLAAACGLAVGGLLVNPGARPSRAGEAVRIAIPPQWLISIGALPLMLIVLSVGLTPLWARDTYLIGTGGGAFSIGLSLSPVGVIAFTLLLFTSRQLLPKVLGVTGIAMYLAVFFALGTRLLAIVPALLVAAYLLTPHRPSPWKTVAVLTVGLVTSFALLTLPLGLRGLSLHGFSPYSHALLTRPVEVLQASTSEAMANFMFGYPLTLVVASKSQGLSWETVSVSLNPLPGHLTNWYEIAPTLRLNEFTPFNAIGELGHFGLAVVALYFVALGLLFGLTWRLRNSLRRRGAALFSVLVIGLTLLICLTATQYNLRSTTRLAYYLVFLTVGLKLVMIVYRSRGRQATPAIPDLDKSPLLS